MARSRLKSGTIELGAQSIEVRVVPGLFKRRRLYGEAHFNKDLILLAGDMTSASAVDTLLHEITHFMLAGAPISSKDEEYIAGAFGRGLASLFRDNPEWIMAILEVFREEKKCQVKSTCKQTAAGVQVPKLWCKPKGRLRPRRT
ncbi:hypothetical protein AMJ85_00250 [candidate division BRC1 bacterium SM23_51]|nr:MAG: hypothetical protein AMJ85_00250 [candidate division BRC1 bacterium SM23_51]